MAHMLVVICRADVCVLDPLAWEQWVHSCVFSDESQHPFHFLETFRPRFGDGVLELHSLRDQFAGIRIQGHRKRHECSDFEGRTCFSRNILRQAKGGEETYQRRWVDLGGVGG